MTPLQRAVESFTGLSLGDALGQCFFGLSEDEALRSIAQRTVPPGPWLYTDDTEMTMSVVEQLAQRADIDQDHLASQIANRYSYDRAYGPSMHRALARIRQGEHWRAVSKSLFDGEGSLGNGAAMRAAPIGAFYRDDLATVVHKATLAAEVTHTHPEGIAGSIAVAVAAAVANMRRNDPPSHAEFLDLVAAQVPNSQVRAGIRKAQDMAVVRHVSFPSSVLGNGKLMAAQDTVPFALWCCAQSLTDYAGAIWLGLEGGVDRDTICAIIGGVVCCGVGTEGIPKDWLEQREPLPEWFALA